MLKFYTTCIKEDHLRYCVREIKFSHLLLFYLLISAYLNPPKFNLNFTFALNFHIIYFFQFLILIKVMRNDKKNSQYIHMFIYTMQITIEQYEDNHKNNIMSNCQREILSNIH